MPSGIFRPIRYKGEDVFLLLTEYEGSDFTFYLRNDEDSPLVREILRRASGAAEDQYQYSCVVHILQPLLGRKDLKNDPGSPGGKSPLLLTRLRENKPGPYSFLHNRLSPGCRALLPTGAAEEGTLVRTLLCEFNSLLRTLPAEELRDGLQASGREREIEDEVAPFAQSGDEEVARVVANRLALGLCCEEAFEKLVPKQGRALAALSGEGEVFSVSFREQKTGGGFAASTEPGQNLNSIQEICHALYEEIFYAAAGGPDARRGRSTESFPGGYRERIDAHRKLTLPEVSGLIVVAGSTNSAKSLITRGLIDLYLDNVKGGRVEGRLPHLVTYEDPIETYYAPASFEPAGGHPQRAVTVAASGSGLDYTPRQKDVDVGRLDEALRDALRQTPKVFFVGETRDRGDWRRLIDFAGTGHLVVTTAHAGSLVEAMHKIFLATEAATPADRGEVAGRILAVVHLKRDELKKSAAAGGYDEYDHNVLVPAVWRRVPRGVNALTAEGLASVLPHSDSDDADPCSCLGRRYFVKNLTALARHRLAGRRAVLNENFEKALTLKATCWDLQGA